MNRIAVITVAALLNGQPVAAQDAAPGLLTSRAPPARVAEVLLPHGAWRPFPRAGETGWNAVPEAMRRACVAAGAAHLGAAWPRLPATLFLEFVREGDRERYQARAFGRRQRLAEQVLAEVIEHEGRFVDDVVDGVWLICEETYWGVPAHVQLQAAGAGLPDVAEPTVDLFAAETAALLAWTHYLLGEELAAVSARVPERIAHEVRRRVLLPCRERDDFWWMGLDGRRVNNWNPWVCSNWLTALLLLETDAAKRAADVSKVLRCLDWFLRGYPADGGCDEGPGYWSRAAGSLFDDLEILHGASGGAIDVFDLPLIGEMGRFVSRACLGGEWFVNFADAAPRPHVDGALVYRYGRAIGDGDLAAFGAAVARVRGLAPERALRFGSLGRVLPALLVQRELAATEPREALPRDVWLPELQVMVARETAASTRGFAVAAKGGHNDESHNHNDVGNVIVFCDGGPVLIDVGVGTYTAKTFSADRYDLWTMRSTHHNLPAPNGVEQRQGRRFAARAVRHASDDERAELTLDLAGAYPDDAKVTRLVRTIRLDRARHRVELRDAFELEEVVAPSTWSLMTPREVEVEDGRLLLRAPGVDDVVLSYAPRTAAVRVEVVALEDARLRTAWGERLQRVVVTLAPASMAREVVFTLTR